MMPNTRVPRIPRTSKDNLFSMTRNEIHQSHPEDLPSTCVVRTHDPDLSIILHTLGDTDADALTDNPLWPTLTRHEFAKTPLCDLTFPLVLTNRRRPAWLISHGKQND